MLQRIEKNIKQPKIYKYLAFLRFLW